MCQLRLVLTALGQSRYMMSLSLRLCPEQPGCRGAGLWIPAQTRTSGFPPAQSSVLTLLPDEMDVHSTSAAGAPGSSVHKPRVLCVYLRTCFQTVSAPFWDVHWLCQPARLGGAQTLGQAVRLCLWRCPQRRGMLQQVGWAAGGVPVRVSLVQSVDGLNRTDSWPLQ